MKSVKKYLRAAYYEALSGVISVPVHDRIKWVEETEAVCIGDVYESPSNNDDTFRTEAIITLEITHQQTNAFTHDRVDEIEEEILSILIPSVDHAGYSITGFQAVNVQRQSSTYIDEFSPESSTARTILKISQILIEQ